MTRQEFERLAQEGVVILDGATGSNYRLAGMPVGVCTEQWAAEHPEVVQKLQRDYIDAGSQIVYAPTFGANRIGLSMYGLEDRLEALNARLMEISLEAAAGRAYVAGDLTTTGRAMEPRGDMTYHALYEVYREQARVLAQAGADLLVFETMLSVDETAAGLDAALSVCDLPVMCTMTLEADGNLLFGGSVTDAVETLQEMGASAVGLNCSVGPDQLEAVVSSMKAVARVPVIVKPNAGMPVMDDQGVAHYDMSPEHFAASMRKLVWHGAGIVGGCCGTSPAYIRQLTEMVKDVKKC